MNKDGRVAKDKAAVFFALLGHQNSLLESLLATLPSESIPPLADTLVNSSMLPLVPESEDDWQAVEKTLAGEATESLFDFLEFLKAGKGGKTTVATPEGPTTSTSSSSVSSTSSTSSSSSSSSSRSSRSSGLFSRRRPALRGGHSTSPPPPPLSPPLTMSAPVKSAAILTSSSVSPSSSSSSSISQAYATATSSTSSSSSSTTTTPSSVLSTSPPGSRLHMPSPVKKKKSDLLSVLPKRRASLANVDSLLPASFSRPVSSDSVFPALQSTSASSLSSSSLASTSTSSMLSVQAPDHPYGTDADGQGGRGPPLLLLVPMVERAMMFELQQSKDRTVLFRSDSNAMIFVSHLLRQFGNPYLRTLLAPAMSEMLAQSRNNFELDPTRLNKKNSPEQLAKKTESRRKRLLAFCNALLRTVFEAASHFPLPVLKISRALYRLLLSQDLDDQQASTFVRSLLFLRWICPLLLTEPWLAPSASGTRSSQRKRSIILVGKLIQSAANGVPPSEPYLDFASDFIERTRRAFARFVRVVTVDYLPITSTAPAPHRPSDSNPEHRCPEHLCPCFSHLHQTVDFDLLHALAIGTPLLPYTTAFTPVVSHLSSQQSPSHAQQQPHLHHQPPTSSHHQFGSIFSTATSSSSSATATSTSAMSSSSSHELSRALSLPRATSPSYFSSASPPPPPSLLSTTPPSTPPHKSKPDSPTKPKRRGGSSIASASAGNVIQTTLHAATQMSSPSGSLLSISPTKNNDPFDSPLSCGSVDSDLNDHSAQMLLSLLSDIASRWTGIAQFLLQKHPEPTSAAKSQWGLMQQLTQPSSDAKLLDDSTFDLVKPAFDTHQMFIWTLDPSLNVEVLLFSQPSPRAQPKGRLFRGADMRLLNQFHLNWVKVKIDDVIGWVQYTLLGRQVLFPSIGIEPNRVVSWLNYQLDSIQDLLEEMCLR